MMGLKNDRFNVIILEQETSKHWAKLNNTNIGFAALHTSGYLLMRVRKENNALLPNLNQAIKAIKTSGKLKEILDNHGIESKIYEASITYFIN